ncbi:putative 5'-3'exonuclease [Rhodococcus phage E3]|uniref:putative 5'-3'exonuclease n=1 Tax=Rhodococcus phage E3 TaxID=1007869 RepID=UPI0002C6A6E5|nr:putative 5'-3'exonuclease [Rhodococcus phage E3]AEQ21059.1 putative 5'-3'exonuclease [Rhodococcus phage E3]
MVIVDGNNVVMRSIFGMANAHLVGPNGLPTGGIFGTIGVFRSLVARLRPTHMLWTFDQGKSAKRLAMYPEYKANRARVYNPEQPGRFHDVNAVKLGTLDGVKSFFGFCGVPYFSMEGVEADDLIAEAALRLTGKMPVTIVSADHDLRQLCTEDGLVQVLKPRAGANDEDVMYDHARVVAEYGLPPRVMPEVWAIQGDTSDNIKGVQGLGPKRATKIIQAYGSLAAAIEKDPRIRENRELVERNLKLISLLDDPEQRLPEGLELCLLPRDILDYPGLLAYCDYWGFDSLTHEMMGGRLW